MIFIYPRIKLFNKGKNLIQKSYLTKEWNSSSTWGTQSIRRKKLEQRALLSFFSFVEEPDSFIEVSIGSYNNYLPCIRGDYPHHNPKRGSLPYIRLAPRRGVSEHYSV